MKSEQNKYWIMIIEYFLIVSFFVLFSGKVERADLTCDVIRKLAPFVLSKLWILVADWSMCWSRDTFLIKLRLYKDVYGTLWHWSKIMKLFHRVVLRKETNICFTLKNCGSQMHPSLCATWRWRTLWTSSRGRSRRPFCNFVHVFYL